MEHDEIREAVRRYAREQLAPNAARWDREKEFPREALKGLAAMGLYGIAIPEEWGGAGLDYTAMAIACEEISAGDCATATIVMVNNLAAGIIHGYGSDDQKRRYLRPLAKGEMLGAFALTEPQVGSDASAISTRAERKDGHYILNGVKQFITSGKNADIAVVFAVTDKGAGKKGISAFLVPTKALPTPRRSRSRTARCRQTICWRRKASVTASRSPTWNPGASMSPRRRPAWRAPRWKRRWRMRKSAKAWASH